ncbi:unnamed protein product, partial [Effrenium voratum]
MKCLALLLVPGVALKAGGVHPNLTPLFNVKALFDRSHLDKRKGVSATLDNVTNQIVVVNEVAEAKAAWAHLADRLNETGWMELHVETPREAFVSNDLKMYSAGLVEGILSAERVSQFYSNFYPLLQPDEDSARAMLNIRNLFNQQIEYIMRKSGLRGGLKAEPADPYWKQVRYLFLQMWGLKDAYNLVAEEKAVRSIDMVDMFFINSHAELGELIQAYSPEAVAARTNVQATKAKRAKRGGSFLQLNDVEHEASALEVDRDWKLRLAKRGHCSAL